MKSRAAVGKRSATETCLYICLPDHMRKFGPNWDIICAIV